MLALPFWLRHPGQWRARRRRHALLAITVPNPLPFPDHGGFRGAAHVHDEMTRQLELQLDALDKADTKIGIIVAFQGAAVAAAAALGTDALKGISHSQTILVAILTAGLLCTLIAMWPRRWASPPNPSDYVRYVHWDEATAQAHVIAALHAGVIYNGRILARKQRWMQTALALLIIGVILFATSAGLHIEGKHI
jgi:pycsar effector protein